MIDDDDEATGKFVEDMMRRVMTMTAETGATVPGENMTINPQELRDHADRIEADDVPAVRAGALLREAADQMQGFFNTREMRRVELERLYAIEKSAVNRDARFTDIVAALEEIAAKDRHFFTDSNTKYEGPYATIANRVLASIKASTS